MLENDVGKLCWELCWKKYVGNEGFAFGIKEFGRSAPFKDIYKYFGLTAENISKKIKNRLKN